MYINGLHHFLPKTFLGLIIYMFLSISMLDICLRIVTLLQLHECLNIRYSSMLVSCSNIVSFNDVFKYLYMYILQLIVLTISR